PVQTQFVAEKNFELKVEKLRQNGQFVPNEELDSLSSKLEVRNDPEKGHYVVAKDAIQFGEPLALLKSFVTVMNPSFELTKCHHCLQDFELSFGSSMFYYF